MSRYAFDPSSRLFVHARSSIHGIDTDADGVEGSLELGILDDGSLDLGAGVHGSLRFALARLSSGNPLYDRETERRIEARRFPVVEASVSSIGVIGPASDDDPGAGWRYAVEGDLSFHGVTQRLAGELGVRGRDGGATVQVWGEQVIDVRAWKVNPPKLGLLKVHPEVQVRLEVTARRV